MRFTICAVLLLAGCVHHVQPLRALSSEGVQATAIAWTADSSLIAYGAEDGIVRICDVRSGRELARTQGYVPNNGFYEMSGLAFSPATQWLAYGTEGGIVRLWDWRAGYSIELIGHSKPLLAAAFSPDGKRLVTASGGLSYSRQPTSAPASSLRETRYGSPSIQKMDVIVFDVQAPQAVARPDAGGFLNIAFSPDIRQFAGLRAATGPDTIWPLHFNSPELAGTRLELVSMDTGDRVRTWPAAGWKTQFSPDGTIILNSQTIWDVASGQHVADTGSNPVVFVNPEDVLLVTAGSSPFSLWPVAVVTSRVKLTHFNVRTARTRYLGEFEPDDDSGRLGAALERAAQFSPDRKLAVDRGMNLWEVPR